MGTLKGSCHCENDGHPDATGCRVSTHSNYDSRQCDRPVKGTWTVRQQFSGSGWRNSKTYEQPMCGIHLGGAKRRKANDERIEAEYRARIEADRRGQENRRSAQDYCDKLAECDVKAEPVGDQWRREDPGRDAVGAGLRTGRPEEDGG